MDDLIPYIGEDDLDRLSRLLEAWDSGRLNPTVPVTPNKPQTPPIETRLALASSDIPALVYTGSGMAVPGGGTATPYYLNVNQTPKPLLWTGEGDYKVYNLYPVKVYAGDWVALVRDPISGQYFVIPTGFALASNASSTNGNSVEVVTDVQCVGGAIQETLKALTGYVTIGGVQYPITFTLT